MKSKKVQERLWKTKRLGDACNIYQPKTISVKEMVSDGKYVVFGANGIIGRYGQYNHEESQLLITCRGATCGSVNISQPKSWITGNAMVIRPKDTSLDLKYLEYIFRGGLDISKVVTGAAQPQITRANLEPVEIIYPESLSEQRRIVKILDEVFGEVAKAKENAEKNLKNSKELFESYLQSVFICKKYKQKMLGEICDTSAGGTPLKSHADYYENGNIPWLRSGEVCQKDIVKNDLFITEKGLKNSAAKVFPINTVLIAMYGATAGQTGILRFPSATNQAVCGIFPSKSFAPEYLYYFFSAIKDDLVKQAVGGAQPNISQMKIRNSFVPIVSLSEQKAIVKKLDALSAETKKLEGIYAKKLADLEELKKSVLRKAFAGEL